MMPEVNIRQAVVGDAMLLHQALLQIAEHLGTPDKVTSTVEDIARHGFGDKPAFCALVAESSGNFAGACIYFQVFSTWMGRPGLYIQDLYVEPGHRRLGVGDALMRRLAEDGLRVGATHLRLSVDAGNTSAQRFYDGLGFSWSDDERIFMVRGEAFARLAAAG